MSEATEGAAAPPPKKRSFFKKAAWQTEPKAEPGKEVDMFSHSNEFRDIMNEARQRREQEKLLKEEKKKRKTSDEHDRKRRKVSSDYEDSKASKKESGTSPRTRRKENKARSRTPRSPSLPTDASTTSLGARYDSLTKSSSTIGPEKSPVKASNVIDLGDSDSDPDYVYKPTRSRLVQLPSQPAPVEDDDIEEMEDPLLAELAAKARARAANNAASTGTPNAASANGQHDPIVQLLITSEIPNSKPLLIRVRCSSTISRPRESWCKIQGFSPEVTRDVFLTWKHKRIFDSTTVKRLGITIDANGIVSVEGDSDIYIEDNLPKIHIEAWTEELFRQMQREEAEEKAAKERAAASPAPVEPDYEPEPAPKVKKTRLFLKAKGKPEWKISVNPEDTTIEHLTSAYKENNGVPADQPVTLLFDGDRLRPMDTIADTEIEDLDSIEVSFK